MEGSSDTVEDKSIEELLLKSREDDGVDSKSYEQDEDSVGDSDVDFDDDLNEDLESVEGDDEVEEEECAENENNDVETTEAPTTSKGKKMVKNINGKKRKRRRKDNTKRRDIRKILDESQLEKETLHAQLEEKERLRRLELQKSLATEMSPALTKNAQDNLVSTENTNEPPRSLSPMVVDFRQKSKQQSHVIVIDSDDDNSGGVQKQQEIEIISSDSVSSSSESDTDNSDIDENNVGMHSDDSYNVPNPDGNVEVNINHPLYEDDIYLAPQIAKHVKPHQIGGIRFLYDNLVETLARYKVSSGFGCILAHSMGLGKTLQVIAFVDIFLRHTPAKKVLCVVPINTIQNWLVEFNMWLPPKPEFVEQENKNSESEDSTNEIRYRNFTVYQLADNNKTTIARAKVIGKWNTNGGVLLIGYELYRILAMSTPCMASNKCAPPKRKKSNASSSAGNQEPEVIDLEEEEKNMDFLIGIQNALCKPGPDLVICDEGHRIKNNQSNISQALKKVKTRRRVVLTGYPLQNNLIEYWCMVDFVRPNFLGTRQEFSNMFERPILNGQCSDSTPSDVRLMRYRAHVLHSLLEGFVQRRSQSVLKKCLPFKEEHIILVKLSPIQSQLYSSYINFLLDSVGHLNPIKGFHTCTKIWNHPDVFFANLEPKKYGMRNESPLTLLDNDTEDGTSQEVNSNVDPALMFSVLPPQVLQQDPHSTTKPVPVGLAWAKDIMKDYQPFIEEQGGKIVILMEILEESLSLGEKVLVFSQSLSTLCIIEDFLSKRDIPHFPGRKTQNDPTKWAKNKSYFRLDGSTPSQERDRLITAFNSPDNTDVLLFMLSTRAGCLGVNLIGASRVVVFDASWNPCHDVQAVCRVYRYGQKKPSHIYRLVSTETMEKKIYDRQVSKQGVANRVVDELNPEANFTKQEIMSLICDKEPDVQAEDVASAANEFSDLVLKRICRNCSNWLSKVPFKHESLLVDKKELKLTKREKREAKKGYEREKNMAQQGGRYNYNPTEPKRIPPAVPPLGNIIRPVAAAYPMHSAQPNVMTSVTQRTQSQAYAFNLPQVSMGSNQYRFASLNHNGSTNPIQLRALLPNMGISRAATPSLRMPINPVAMSTSVTNPLGSPLIFPSQAAILANVNQRIMQAGANFASNLVSSLPGTNGNVMSWTSVGRGLPLESSGQTRPRTNDVVTIDLDDVPSPPEYVGSQNDTTNKLRGQEYRKDNTHAKQTSSTVNELTPMATESLKNCESESMAFDQQPFVSMETSDKNFLNHVNTSTFASMATENVINAGYSSEPVAMGTGVARGDDAYTSMNESLGNGLQSPARSESSSTTGFTDSQLTLAVLQNLLNSRGGLDASASSPEESAPDNSSSSTSQL